MKYKSNLQEMCSAFSRPENGYTVDQRCRALAGAGCAEILNDEKFQKLIFVWFYFEYSLSHEIVDLLNA